jgi:hypothetical protein
MGSAPLLTRSRHVGTDLSMSASAISLFDIHQRPNFRTDDISDGTKLWHALNGMETPVVMRWP